MGEIFDGIISEICNEKNIEIKEVSYGWIKILKKDKKTRYIVGYTFELNSAVSKNISKDKYATYEILKYNGIPIIEHNIVFNPVTRSDYYKKEHIDTAKGLLNSYKKIIIKANDSSCGREVYCCENEDDIEKIIYNLFENNNNSLSVCPFINIKYEYRAIYLYGDIIYLYKKTKPYVIGNGINDLGFLINEKKIKDNIDIDIISTLDLQYVPKENEKVVISWKHNLSNSAEPILIDDSDIYASKIKEIAIKVGNALNISFASIDICLTDDNEIYVMEVNSNVCMAKFSQKALNGYQIVKEIYSKAIDKMFGE